MEFGETKRPIVGNCKRNMLWLQIIKLQFRFRQDLRAAIELQSVLERVKCCHLLQVNRGVFMIVLTFGTYAYRGPSLRPI